MPTAPSTEMTEPIDGPAEPAEPEVGRLTRWFGPLTGIRIVVLVLAIAFLAGAVAYVVGEERGARDPLSAVDVGFMQDMTRHHAQAVEMALILLSKPGIDPSLRSYATEIVADQRYEMGIMDSTLARFGHATDAGPMAMGWMGPSIPVSQMPGLATDAQLAQLRAAKGRDAEALWIGLMARHHLGGIHMADEAYRRGHDPTVRNQALAMEKAQRGDIYDHDAFRRAAKLPILPGFTDPTKDPGLSPPSLSGD